MGGVSLEPACRPLAAAVAGRRLVLDGVAVMAFVYALVPLGAFLLGVIAGHTYAGLSK